MTKYLGVRTANGMYSLIHGYRDAVVVGYHDFSDETDTAAVEAAWQAWLGRTFAA